MSQHSSTEQQKTNPVMDMLKVHANKEGELPIQLFKTDDKDVDLKTDAEYPEDIYVSVLKYNGRFLVSKGLKDPYENYIKDLLRIRFSLDRKSREEFVGASARPLSNFQIPGVSKDIEEVRK